MAWTWAGAVGTFLSIFMHISLTAQLPHIAALCERHGVAHLELFGSAAGPQFNPETSDFDFLVELDTHLPGSRAKRWMKTDLAALLAQRG
jgi:predicted nucleotidyltransferase